MKSIRIENMPLHAYKIDGKRRGKEFLGILKESLEQWQSTYIVRKGDNLTKLVRNFLDSTKSKGNVTQLVAQLAEDNDLQNPDFILEGQKLNISSLIALAPQPSPSSPFTREEIRGSERANFSQEEIFSNHKQSFMSAVRRPQRISMEDGLRRMNVYSRMDRSKKLLQIIHKMSLTNEMNPYLATAVARAESGISANYERRILLDSYAVSPDLKSKGLFQLLDKTGKRFHEMLGLGGRYNPFNIWQNIKIGINYLKYLDEIFAKETVLAEDLNTIPISDSSERKYFYIAAFNSGEGTVAQAQQVAKEQGKDPHVFRHIEKYLPLTTQFYVKSVLRFLRMLT